MLVNIKDKFNMTEEQKKELQKKAVNVAASIAVGITVQVVVHYGAKAVTGQIDSVIEHWQSLKEEVVED